MLQRRCSWTLVCYLQLCFQIRSRTEHGFRHPLRGWGLGQRCASCGGGLSGKCVCTGGDQTACVPTLASMGTRRFESWSIIWGKKNCIISPRWGAACRARCVQGEVQAVAPCDLSRSLAPHHSPPTAWFKGRCGVKGGHSVGCDTGRQVHMGARWVEGG